MQTSPLYHFPAETYLKLQAAPTLCEHHQQPQWQAPSFKTQKTDQDERNLYQQECKIDLLPSIVHVQENKSLTNRIEMAMILLTQNQQLAKKIQQVTRQLEEQKLKTRIFSEQVSKNDILIAQLKKKEEEVAGKESERMLTLNQSLIPGKSNEMSTTYNTSSWINQFLDKESLQSLWNSKTLKDNCKTDKVDRPIIKYATIDLTSALSNRNQREFNNSKSNKITQIKEDCMHQKEQIRLKLEKNKQKNKKTIVSVAHNVRQSYNRYDSKVKLAEKNKKYGQLYEKKTQVQKPLSYLRNPKKIKNTIEV